MRYELYILSTLVPTVLIELGVLWLLLERRRRVLWSSVAVNVLTNVPLCLWFLHYETTWTSMLVAELLVFGVEALWYRWFVGQWCQAFVYAFLCNAISYLLGLLFQLLCLVI